MSKYLKLPWKKNFRRVPEWVHNKVRGINGNFFVEWVKLIGPDDSAAGKYAHLNLSSIPNTVYPLRLVPNELVGRYSAWNANGRETVRKDLPKVEKIFGPYDIPIYGDPSKGWCSVNIPRQVYQRERSEPKRLEIVIDRLDSNTDDGSYVLRFRVNEVLNPTSATLADELLYSLNLLQENVGHVNVYPINTPVVQYLATENVPWKFLPPGEDSRERLLGTFGGSTEDVRALVNDRFDLLSTLSPISFLTGMDGFDHYFGAKFSDRLIVLENVKYGNAIYLMNEQWQKLSQWTRTDLRKQKPDGFIHRVPHRGYWEDRLRQLVNDNR